jgi:3'-5' exoribonuclease
LEDLGQTGQLTEGAARVVDKIFVKDLSEKQIVETFFLVRNKNVQVGKNGRPYMSLVLADKSGVIDSRMWDRVDELSELFDIGDIVKIKGQVQLFQNRKQLVVHRIEKPEQSEFDLNVFMSQSRGNAEEMFAELAVLVRSMKSNELRQLVLDTIEDAEIKPKFLKAPAARSIHHAWIGGLLEHVLSMCKLMDFMASHYGRTYNINRDLLIFGAIFHDIGKVWELDFDHGIQYTHRGRLIGHMTMACELIDRKAARIMGFPEELRDLCKHIILSHHGKLEYGSPKRPKFLEAVIVAMIDDLDSKINTIGEFIHNERQATQGASLNWSRYNELFDRYFFLDNLTEKF